MNRDHKRPRSLIRLTLRDLSGIPATGGRGTAPTGSNGVGDLRDGGGGGACPPTGPTITE